MIRILGTYAYGPRIRNNLPCRKARLAFRDIRTTAEGATSEFMGKSHRHLMSLTNNFGFKQIGAVHPSRLLFQTSCARSHSSMALGRRAVSILAVLLYGARPVDMDSLNDVTTPLKLWPTSANCCATSTPPWRRAGWNGCNLLRTGVTSVQGKSATIRRLAARGRHAQTTGLSID